MRRTTALFPNNNNVSLVRRTPPALEASATGEQPQVLWEAQPFPAAEGLTPHILTPGQCYAVSCVHIAASRNATASTVDARDVKTRQRKGKERSRSKSCGTSCSLDLLFFWWLLQGELQPGLFQVRSLVPKEQTDRPFPKQKDLPHLIRHVFSQNIQEFWSPQACCWTQLKTNSELRSHLGVQQDTRPCRLSRRPEGKPWQGTMPRAGWGTRGSVQDTGLDELGLQLDVTLAIPDSYCFTSS